jgi:ribosomal protein S18 acetylase RimI-like enzyme
MRVGEENRIRDLLAKLDYEDQIYWTPRAETLEQRQAKRSQVRISEDVRAKNVVFVGEEDNAIVGFCWCTVIDRGVDEQGDIAELYVEKEYRGEGIGAELITAATQLFIKEKLAVAFVFTHYDNEDAIKLYENAGFKKIKQLALYFVPPDH